MALEAWRDGAKAQEEVIPLAALTTALAFS
jgi:hypothetical protein